METSLVLRKPGPCVCGTHPVFEARDAILMLRQA
jgi:hypothetical protein